MPPTYIVSNSPLGRCRHVFENNFFKLIYGLKKNKRERLRVFYHKHYTYKTTTTISSSGLHLDKNERPLLQQETKSCRT